MSITINVDPTKLQAKLREFAAVSKREWKDILFDEMRLLVTDLIKITAPPYGENASKKGKELGDKAVANDIRRVFISTEQLCEHLKNDKLANRIRKYVADGNVVALEGVFKNFRTHILGVSQRVDRSLHSEARIAGGRGRVARNTPTTIILDERNLAAYDKEIQGHVGKAKAGWLHAAMRFGCRIIPGWVRKHPSMEGSSSVVDSPKGPTLWAINRSKAIGSLNNQQKLVSNATKQRIRSLTKKIEDQIKRSNGWTGHRR